MVIGGSIVEVTLNGRRFTVSADADGNRKLGGDENQVEPNGDGSGRLIKTKGVWSMEGLTLAIDDDRGDQEYIQDLADGQVFFPMTFTHASGKVYGGTGQITDETTFSTQNATASPTFKGTGKLVQL